MYPGFRVTGTDRDEKRALRQAEDAERAFRTSRGYAHENLVDRLTRKIQNLT